jgi:2-polyprenyl-3-methyl-5-hydroxy-6-metoxy-1,4-benzoquinol methylase
MISQQDLDHKHSEVPPEYYAEGVKKNLFQKIWHGKRRVVIKKAINKRGGRLLDLGCHGGYMTNYLYHLTGGEVWGIDISVPAIDYARKKYPNLHFRVGDIQERTAFADDQFDWVTSFDVLEHVPNTGSAIKEARRVLKPGGFLVVGIPLENKLLFRIAWNLWKKYRGKVWEDVHIHIFSEKNFIKQVKKHKFDVIEAWKSHGRTYLMMKFQKR